MIAISSDSSGSGPDGMYTMMKPVPGGNMPGVRADIFLYCLSRHMLIKEHNNYKAFYFLYFWHSKIVWYKFIFNKLVSASCTFFTFLAVLICFLELLWYAVKKSYFCLFFNEN